MRYILNKTIFFFLFLLVTFVGTAARASGDRVRVVTTIGMIADVVTNIGGEHVSVRSLMGEGVDPHLYKASPGDLRLLNEADIIFFNGLHLEGKMGDTLKRIGERKPAVAVADAIDRSLLRQPAEFEGQYDPHVWFDVSLWRRAAERIRDTLKAHDPAHGPVFDRRAAEYLERLAALDRWCKEELGRIPEEQRVLVTAHDAFGYFGRAYGVEVHGIQGMSTESEASIRDINHLIDLIVERRIPAVFIESSVPRKTVDALVEGCRARGHGLEVGGELFSDSMGQAGTEEGTYIGMVRHNVRTIVSALLRGAK